MPSSPVSLTQAINIILDGGLVIYPTETFCALGCHPDNTLALDWIYRIKQRPKSKPLPLLAANTRSAAQLVDLTQTPEGLTEAFWPGPLTLLLPAKKHLAQAFLNQQHKAAVRVSPHPGAIRLAAACGGHLPSTSANFSGMPAAASIDALDHKFMAQCQKSGLPFTICENGPPPCHVAPSTLAEPLCANGRWRLRILRPGSIDATRLANSQWDVTT